MAVDAPLPADTGRFHDDLGVWMRAAAPPPGPPRSALFLDRDGVIVEDCGHLGHAADVRMIPGAAETIAYANRLHIPVVEVTNQAGIARGYYDWAGFLEVENLITGELARVGAALDAVVACPYHRNGIEPWRHPEHPARKPRPGMLLAAAQILNLDLSQSWIVGDKVSDLEAGQRAGLRGAVHVLTGHGQDHRRDAVHKNPPGFELRLADSIADLALVIALLAS